MVAAGLKDGSGGVGSRCARSQGAWTAETAQALAAGAKAAVGAGFCAEPRDGPILGALRLCHMLLQGCKGCSTHPSGLSVIFFFFFFAALPTRTMPEALPSCYPWCSAHSPTSDALRFSRIWHFGAFEDSAAGTIISLLVSVFTQAPSVTPRAFTGLAGLLLSRFTRGLSPSPPHQGKGRTPKTLSPSHR